MIDSKFFKRVSTVFLGTLGAQLITISVMLILVRLFSPAEIGLFAVWLSIVRMLAVTVTGRYELAFFSLSNNSEAYSIGKLVLVISVAMTIVIYVLLQFYTQLIGPLMPPVDEYLIGLVIAVFSLGINKGLTSLLAFQQKFNYLGFARIAIAASIALSQVVAGVFALGVSGLIYGHLVGLLLGTVVILLWIDTEWLKSCLGQSKATMWRALKSYTNFPKYSLPADFVNAAANQLPLILIASRFGVASAGLYALTLRVMGAPIGLLATSILDVFKEQAARDYRETGNCESVFLATFKALALLALLPFIALWFVSEWLFGFFFGAEWIEAGRYVTIMIPLFYMRFVVSPLSYTIYIAQKQKYDLIWQLCLLTMMLLIFTLMPTIDSALIWFSWCYAFMYFIYFWLSYFCAKGNKK